MPTDDERREVARRLWELSRCVFSPENTYELLADAFGVDDFEDTSDLFNRLADLIETDYDRIQGEPCTMEGAPCPGKALPEIDTCDRDALLALAEDVDGAADDSGGLEPLAGMLRDIARRIREACGEEVS